MVGGGAMAMISLWPVYGLIRLIESASNDANVRRRETVIDFEIGNWMIGRWYYVGIQFIDIGMH